MDEEILDGVTGESGALDEDFEDFSLLEEEADALEPDFGDVQDDSEGAESLQETPEDTPDGTEEQEGASSEETQVDSVEWGGQEYSVPDLVRDASFGRQAAGEVLKLREEMAFLDEFAALSGMEREEYLTALRGQLEQVRVAKIAEEQGVTPEAAGQLIAEQRRREQAEAALRQRQAQELEARRRQSEMEPWVELLRRFPELHDKDKLPKEVIAEIQRGAHPVVAYQDYILRTQQTQSQVQRQRQAVRAKSPGSATGVGDGMDDDGAFAAFDAVMNGLV